MMLTSPKKIMISNIFLPQEREIYLENEDVNDRHLLLAYQCLPNQLATM